MGTDIREGEDLKNFLMTIPEDKAAHYVSSKELPERTKKLVELAKTLRKTKDS